MNRGSRQTGAERPALREGFTTGSAIAGAAAAALSFLLHNRIPAAVDVPLPPFTGKTLRLPVAVCRAGLAEEVAAVHAPWALSASRGKGQRLWTLGGVQRTASRWQQQLELFQASPSPCLHGWRTVIGQAGQIVHARIVKDGGDDPDATHNALISATLLCLPPQVVPCMGVRLPSSVLPLFFMGGPGVGRATLPGLPVPVGEPAINPVPRQQLVAAVEAVLRSVPVEQHPAGLCVIASVPHGEEIAHRTFNPRLGILGGISLLGTQGTVRPYSHQAWKASIAQGMDVARALGCVGLGLSTGRRSERFLMARYAHWPEQAFVQVADFAEFSLDLAGRKEFAVLAWGCFFGKAVKLAQGHGYTHAQDASLDMVQLARLCAAAHVSCSQRIAGCVTAAHALELLLQEAEQGMSVIHEVACRAARTVQRFAGRPVCFHLFDQDGEELSCVCP